MKSFGHTVCEIEHHDRLRSGIFAYEFREEGPRQWTKQALKTLEEAPEMYMIEAIAESSFQKQQHIYVGFQHVCYYRKARRSGTARTV